jgi:hypothetical protein
MADGFLGRWSKRKLDAKDGGPLPQDSPASEPLPGAVVVPHGVVPAGAVNPAKAGTQAPPAASVSPASPEPPPLTLEDAHALTSESDFRPFAMRDVAPEVRNAAMKKLFSDPHFNVMDRLDTYIDDYSQPDPIPREMLRKLASAKFLGLFDAEEKLEAEQAAEEERRLREAADNPTNRTVAQSAAAPAVPSALSNDDPDLRLQQDDAPAGKAPGHGVA